VNTASITEPKPAMNAAEPFAHAARL